MMTVEASGTYRDGDGWWVIERIDGEVVFFGQPPDGCAFHEEETALIALASGIVVRRPEVVRGVDIREA